MSNKIDDTFLSYACNWFGETKGGLSGANIIRFCQKYSVMYGVKLVYEATDMYTTGGKNKATIFALNLKEFQGKHQFEMLIELCKMPEFSIHPQTLEIQSRLIERYSEFAPDPSDLLDISIITETNHLLDDYPQVKIHYESALIKYQTQIFERNLVDDLRFSFEQLLKNVLSNDRPLEKQQDDISKFLKAKGISDSLISMYNKLREYYCDYQNIHAKHNDQIKKQELEFIIELTSIMMKLLLRTTIISP